MVVTQPQVVAVELHGTVAVIETAARLAVGVHLIILAEPEIHQL